MNYDANIEPGARAEVAHFDPLAGTGEEDRQSARRIWLIVALVIIATVAIWFLMNKTGTSELAGKSGQAPAVTVIAPGNTTIAGVINTTGTLAARRELPVGSAGEGGQVLSVLVEPGDWVGAGQVLAVVDRSVQVQQQASLAAQIQVSTADARLAQANLDRALKLVDRGFISKADVDRLTAARDVAAARVKVAQAQFGEMQARTRRLNIIAPAAGLVLERNVEPGQVVSAGSGMLFSIAKGGELEMLGDLSEQDLAQIFVGQSAEVTPVGSPRSFTGQIWQVAPIISEQNRQGKVRIALAYDPQLRPGGFASARITAGALRAPLLPEASVLSDDKGSYVYVVDKDNKVRRRSVATGAITPDGIVIAKGLSGNERIVKRAGAFLSNGETVSPKLVKP